MSPKSRRRFFNVKTLIGLAISIAGLYLGFRKFDSVGFFAALKQTHLGLFCLAMLVMIFNVFLRAIRWRYLVLPLQQVPLKQLFGAEMICYFGNNVFPLRLGEILRAYSLSKISSLSAISVFGTIVVERLLDVVFFLIILIVAVLLYPTMPSFIKWSGAAAGLALILFLTVYFIFQWKQSTLKKYFNHKLTNTRFHKLLASLRLLFQGMNTFRHTPHRLLIMFWTVVIWLMSIFVYWLIGTSLQFFFSIQNLLLIFIVTSLIISVPSAPGYVGTYHAGAIAMLVYLGYELTQAQVIAIILHAAGFISLTFVGLFYFLKYQIHMADTSLEKLPIDNDY
jgi:uncharacterized protein (TIRG00374 family)